MVFLVKIELQGFYKFHIQYPAVTPEAEMPKTVPHTLDLEHKG